MSLYETTGNEQIKEQYSTCTWFIEIFYFCRSTKVSNKLAATEGLLKILNDKNQFEIP